MQEISLGTYITVLNQKVQYMTNVMQRTQTY